MTMMCGGVGLKWRARRSIPVELHLDKPPLVPLYNVILWVNAAPFCEVG
jgi:hypothetical protein